MLGHPQNLINKPILSYIYLLLGTQEHKSKKEMAGKETQNYSWKLSPRLFNLDANVKMIVHLTSSAEMK